MRVTRVPAPKPPPDTLNIELSWEEAAHLLTILYYGPHENCPDRLCGVVFINNLYSMMLQAGVKRQSGG